jgi:archaellum biogenesis protein FlaJ (TadC family)
MSIILYLIGYLFTVVLAYVLFGLFVMRFPHEKLWYTREMDFASYAKKYKEAPGERAFIFFLCIVWPPSLLCFFVINSFIAICIGADNLLEFLLAKTSGKDKG